MVAFQPMRVPRERHEDNASPVGSIMSDTTISISLSYDVS